MSLKTLIAGMVLILIVGSVFGKDVDRRFLDVSEIKLQAWWSDALSKKYRFTAKDAPLRDVLQMVTTRAKIACRMHPTPDKSVTLKGDEMTLREVFWEINQQTGCRFVLADPYLIIGTNELH